MKKLLLFAFAAIFALPSLAARLVEYTYEDQTLTYSIINEEDKIAMVYHVIDHGIQGDLIIPSTIEDKAGGVYTVTSIRSSAFKDCDQLNSVFIPNSIASIGESAFKECTGLRKAIFESLEGLCKIQFDYPTSNPVYYAHHIWIGDSEVTDLIIPDTIYEIPQYTFYQCYGLTSVTIHSSITTVGKQAFAYCKNIKSVIVEECEEELLFEDYAFQDARYIEELFLGRNIPSLSKFVDQLPFSNIWTLNHLAIGHNVTYIDLSTFFGCCGLTSIEIPDSVTSIDYHAFAFCRDLTTVRFPPSLTSITPMAFENCPNLSSIYYNAEHPITCESYIFDESIYSSATLYVPDKAIEEYKSTQPWNKFVSISPDNLTSVDNVETDIDFSDQYEVYNLHGVKCSPDLHSLTPGIYIVQQDNHTKKFVVL